jgi:hypothetical protein
MPRQPIHAKRGGFLARLAVVGAVCWLSLAPRGDAQVMDLRTRYRTIETEHFVIHYHEPLSVVARRVAAILERAHANLAMLLGEGSSRLKVQVALTDGAESSNGSATALPVNTIRLFATAPADLSALGDFDDWLTLLVIHEHAHILHLDNIGGIPWLVNHLVGKVWAPNHVLPRFVTEGIATYLESARSSGGRLRGSQFEMYMRMAALEDRFLRLDELTNGTDFWPHGNTFYLYGSRFWQFIVERHGEAVLEKLATFYGKRAIPFGFNRALKRATGETFEELYGAFLAHELAEAREVEARVLAEGVVAGDRLTFHGETAEYPRFLRDGRLVYYASDGRSDPQLRMLDLETGKAKQLTRVTGSSAASVSPDGSVIHESLDSRRNLYFFYDLFRVHPDRRGRERLSHGLRARAPDVSPDGKRVAFTIDGASTTHLAIADLDDVDGTTEILVRSERFDQIYTPRFSPDGRFLAYSIHRKGGMRDIELVDLSTRERRRLTYDCALDMGPAFSPDGRHLYFTSDRTGVANVYRVELESGEVERITNVVGGAYMPAISPDGRTLVYVGYHSRGFDLYRVDLTSLTPTPAAPYVDERPPSVELDEMRALTSRRYAAIRTLHPRYVAFDLRDTVLGRQLGVLLEGQDIAEHHAWNLRMGLGLEQGFVETEARYRLARLPIPLDVSFYQRRGVESAVVVDRVRLPYDMRYLGAEIGASYRFFDSFRSHTLAARWSLTHSAPIDGLPVPIDPNAVIWPLPQYGFTGTTRFRYAYSDARRHIYDITPSEGRRFVVDGAVRRPTRGTTLASGSGVATLDQFFENPWVQHHVLVVGLQGGMTFGPEGARGGYYLGGFPSTNLLESFINGEMLGGRALRGYPVGAFFGDRFYLANLEYRFPIARVNRGVTTLPISFDRFYASIFANFGDAFFGAPTLSGIKGGAGAELFTDLLLGYYLPFTVRIGGAYGWNERGGFSGYVNLGVPF